MAEGTTLKRPRTRDEEIQHLMDRFPSGIALEDFTRLSDSLELRIGRAYWGQRGADAFTNSEVPSNITNDGVRASRAAEVLLANCEEAERSGTLQGPIVVLELGVGLGLFARLLLKRFRTLCAEAGRGYFARLRYLATDFSRQNLLDIRRQGTLDEYGEQVQLAVLDATRPATLTRLDAAEPEPTPTSLRAVFHNYLYDALPQSLVLRQERHWYELRVQTRLTEPWRLPAYTSHSFDELMNRVAQGGDAAVAALAPAYGLIQVERSFFPIERQQIPYAAVVEQFADEELQPYVDASIGEGRNVRMWVPWGAFASACETLELLAPNGFMLFTDYGPTELSGVQGARAWQRYGAGVCINVNFPLLSRFLGGRGHHVVAAPQDDMLSLHARLVSPGPLEATRVCFQERFAGADFMTLQSHLDEARAILENDVPGAMALYEKALELFPDNWFVLGEFAHVHNFQADAPAVALEFADRALALNSTCSADLWCERGDALHRLGDGPEAEHAYRRATEINPSHSRSYYNLAWVMSDRDAFGSALEVIGKGLACDPNGVQTDLLLEKQSEILARRKSAQEAEKERMALRYS